MAQLFADERRCPRCGATLNDDRRSQDRRVIMRRQERHGVSPTGDERRREDRRLGQRRRVGVA